MLTHTDYNKSSSVAKVNKNPVQIRAHEGTGEQNVNILHYILLQFIGNLCWQIDPQLYIFLQLSSSVIEYQH